MEPRKLGPTQGHVMVVTCRPFRVGAWHTSLDISQDLHFKTWALKLVKVSILKPEPQGPFWNSIFIKQESILLRQNVPKCSQWPNLQKKLQYPYFLSKGKIVISSIIQEFRVNSWINKFISRSSSKILIFKSVNLKFWLESSC